ncbi:Ig-like domain-containing protein [Saccharibacillus qingshengii]|uniref:Ig-like domain-containing protein n=1 Tax=Saccharibacillus qingshengii TaxID=1763540 RepID=UPI0015562271|nr:Ig-like domain-containing protein [Saccharibacillus qingshengii]
MKNKIAAGLVCVLAANLLAAGPIPITGSYSVAQAAGEVVALQAAFAPTITTTGVSQRPALSIVFKSPVQLGDTPTGKFFTMNKKTDGIDAPLFTIRGDKLRISADGLRVDLPLEAAVWADASTALEADTDYYVEASAGILKTKPATAQEVAVPWAGIPSTAKTTWTFHTAADADDKTAPKLRAQLPKNGTIAVPVKSELVLDFDEDVEFNEAEIENLRIAKLDGTNGTAGPPILLTADQVKGSNTARIVISGLNLDNSTEYQVSYTAAVFADTANNPAAALAAGSWKFRTVAKDDKPPVVTGFSPRPGVVVGASLNDPLALTFSEPILPAADSEKQSVKIYRLDTNQLIETVDASSLTVDTDNPRIILVPHAALVSGFSYYVTVDAGALIDLDGRPYAGTSKASDWTFTTASTGSALTLTALSPANGAVGAAKSSNLQLSFNRPIYPSSISGASLTVTRSGGAVHETLPLSSGQLSGFGTSTLKVTLTKPVEAGYVYSVALMNGSLQDAEGNAFPSAERPLNWSFSTITDGQSIAMTSLSPADRSIDVPLDAPIRIAFNRKVALGSGNITLNKGNGTKVAAQVSVNPSNTAEVLIVPASVMDAGTSYYVDLPAGSVTDAVSTGIQYAGLNGQERWSFRTAAADTTLPTIQSAAMNSSNQIRLTYNKQLDSVSYPLLSSYSVTVNGEKRSVNDMYVRGESVYLTLDTGAAVGQDVKISYVPDVRPLRDLKGNKAAALNSYAVTNKIETALPKPVEGTAYSRSINLTFASPLGSIDNRAYEQFRATADGGTLGIEGITYTGKSITLYTTSTIPDGSIVSVSYSPGAYPIKDSSGQNLSAFQSFNVRNLLDRRPPEFVSAELSGKELILNYNEALATDQLPTNSQFSVLASGLPVYVTAVAVDGPKVRLTLASSLIAASGISVSYVPGVLKLTDLNLNAAGYLNLQPVGAASGSSGIRSATVNGTALQLTFTGALMASAVPQVEQFNVFADEAYAGISNVSITGSTVSLNLSSPVKAGQKVQISYTPSKEPLKNAGNTPVPAFSRLAVDNLTGTAAGSGAAGGQSLPVMSGSEFGSSMSILGMGAATSTISNTKYNQDTHTYTLQPAALQSALETSLTNGTRSVVFDTPATDNSGVVNIPLPILAEMARKSNNLSVAVRYKNTLLELPLKSVQSLMSASPTSAYVQVAIEPVPAAASIALRSTLMESSAEALTDPVDIRLTPLTSGMSDSANAPAVTGNYYFKLPVSSPKEKTSVVYEDSDSSRPFFVPSYLDASKTGTIINGTTVGSRVLTPVTTTYAYADMNSHWAKDTVNELASKFILETKNGSAFSPNATINRGAFAEYIARGMGLPYDAVAANQFKDANYSRYLGGAIGAAVKAGIINGNTDGTFRANDPITREQMAAMMVRALHYAGIDPTLNNGTADVLGKFKDNKAITFTTESAKAVRAGVIKGGSDGKFNPKGNATQAEAATMLQRVLQEAGYLN